MTKTDIGDFLALNAMQRSVMRNHLVTTIESFLAQTERIEWMDTAGRAAVGLPPYYDDEERFREYCVSINARVTAIQRALGVDAATLLQLRAAARARLAAKTEFLVVHGVLEGFFETGSEGVHWSVYEDDKTGYDGLHAIEDGDHLVVTSEDGTVLFDGEIHWDWRVGYRPYPLNPEYGQQAACGMWVHGIQKGWEPEAWGKLFFRLRGEPERQPYRAVLTKKPFLHDKYSPA